MLSTPSSPEGQLSSVVGLGRTFRGSGASPGIQRNLGLPMFPLVETAGSLPWEDSGSEFLGQQFIATKP
jgi:hypothetical protein